MVVDVNVLIAILMEDTAAKTLFIKTHSFEAPAFLKPELINVLRKFHFFNNLSLDTCFGYYTQGIALIDNFVIDEILLEKAIEYSFQLNHPIYDCLYLSLAKVLNEPFVSLDKKLLIKAKVLGIEIIDFTEI